MIINRYIARHLYQGTLLTLCVLVSLSLLFVFMNELEDIGKGYYNIPLAIKYMGLLIPGKIVELLPLAVLLGTMLSLGSLAGQSEIIVMQAAGVSVLQLLRAVIQAVLVLALLSFILAEWVVPDAEIKARNTRLSAINSTTAVLSKKGLWLNDGKNILHIRLLMPKGMARDLKVYTFGDQDNLISILSAESAIPKGTKWRLQNVRQTQFEDKKTSTQVFDQLTYQGNISDHLLTALLTDSQQMSSIELHTYIEFLAQNNLEADAEKLSFWKKILAPFTMIIMGIMTLPFSLGSSRQGNAGQRLTMGMLLGLSYIAVDHVLTQLGIYLGFIPVLNALLPKILFLILAFYLLNKRRI